MRTRYDHLSLIAGLIFLASLLVPIAISEAAPDNLEFPAELFEGDVLNPVAFEDPVPFIERIQIRGELSDDELMLFLTLLQQIVQSGKANGADLSASRTCHVVQFLAKEFPGTVPKKEAVINLDDLLDQVWELQAVRMHRKRTGQK
ncbi:MAG: hypothetical protein HRU46_10385 [Verrucomicrobiales bacterium]|nr:hypothetical protein [Verrucomicrobiales bacterium]